MNTRITQSQLESYLWGAAVRLRGYIDAGDYKQFIFPLLFFKRLCDVFDEEVASALAESGGDEAYAHFAENHRFQIPDEAHWNSVRKAGKNVGTKVQNALRAIETANPDKLFGIFGDAQWTNKDRLPDHTLKELIEHFSTLTLSVKNCPEDELGVGYEYLIKKFADDSGHTAAEFYTNRTVVHLMTELLQPQPGESIYDPTCGSGGMLLSSIAHLRQQKKEWRTVKLFGQERNLMTSSIARMNCFLHGVEDFEIVRGDTLSEPKFVVGDRLQQFDVCLANPPYSIKQWDREAFGSDPWGRNIYGTPPQGRADYAFQQHVIQSINPKTGRCAVLWPHGILFRNEEDDIRRHFVESDCIEAIIGLGPNLFYNSSMQSCIVVCRSSKPSSRRGRLLFIDAVNEVTRERAQSFLSIANIHRIVGTYRSFRTIPGFSTVATLEQIKNHHFSLNIPLYVHPTSTTEGALSTDGSVGCDNVVRGCFASCNVVRDEIRKLLPGKYNQSFTSTPRTTNSIAGAVIDREKWENLQLGDVCDEVSIRVDDPGASGQPRFVGLEHFDSGDFKISRWGNSDSLGSSMKSFSAGDILFARRNAYLKRASLADFDGLCSGDAIVLRERHSKVVPGFLALVLNTKRFWEFAISNAAGTMSRRVNGKTLLRYEFSLPPLEQQTHIAQILWTAEEMRLLYCDLLSTLEKTRIALCSQYYERKATSSTNVRVVRIKDIGAIDRQSVQVGPFGGSICSRHFAPSGIPVVKVNNINNEGEVSLVDPVYISDAHARSLGRYAVVAGDVLIAAQGDTTGKAGLAGDDVAGGIISQHLIRIALNHGLCRPRFVAAALCSKPVQAQIEAVKIKSTRPGLNTTDVENFQIALPGLDAQDEVCRQLEQVEYSKRRCRAAITDASRLRTFLLNGLINDVP